MHIEKLDNLTYQTVFFSGNLLLDPFDFIFIFMHVHGGEGHVPQAVCGGQRTTSPMESVTFLHLYFGSGNELRSSGCCKQVLYPPGQLAALLDPFSKPVKIEIRTFLS